ncbi:hypothetical protein FSP39_017217 [Pinctada imbricata]|uniref:Uncharacterized protein n=1 Tax=Pinctada imbricata TaxID=66713 RepID=A0AA89BRD6_PINIB|nr:hypothetical protein FSP39_017217 [Pinctada imbricata]
MMEHVIAWICLIWMNILYIWTDDSCMSSVSQCPLTQSEWMARSISFNCSAAPEILNYTCIFNARDELVETCTTNYPILPRYDGCPVVTSCRRNQAIVGERKLYRECPYNVTGCPQQNHERYTVNELYKYDTYNEIDAGDQMIRRVSKDTKVNSSGRRLLSICGRTGLRIVNGRIGDDSNIESQIEVSKNEEEETFFDGQHESQIEVSKNDEEETFFDGQHESAALCEECGVMKNVLTGRLYFEGIPVCLTCEGGPSGHGRRGLTNALWFYVKLEKKSETEGMQNQDKTETKANKQKPPPHEKKRTPDMRVRPGAQEE